MSLLCLPFWNEFWFSSLTPWDGRNTVRAYSNSSIRVEWYLTPNLNIADGYEMWLERRADGSLIVTAECWRQTL